MTSIRRLKDLCTSIPEDLQANIELVEKMYGHMNVTLMSPPVDERDESGAAAFHETLGGFYSFDIIVWESLQGKDKYYVGESKWSSLMVSFWSTDSSVDPCTDPSWSKMVPLVPSGMPRVSIPVPCWKVDKMPPLTPEDIPCVSPWGKNKVTSVQLVS